MAPIIETHDLSKHYKTREGEVHAVEQLNLSIEKGEFFCLLGPNGAGKTTTIKMLITLTRPTSGTATVCGYDIRTDTIQVRRTIGYASQDVIADEMLTGRENLSLVGRLQGVSGRELKEAVQRMLDMLDLTQWADRLVKTYSGGMRKKLDIAAALIHTPTIMFLDEPTLGLDPQARHIIWDYLIRQNKERGTTLFMTTHYLDEADALAHRVAVIDHGEIKAMGAPEALKCEVGGQTVEVKLADQQSTEIVQAASHKIKQIPHVREVLQHDHSLIVYTDGKQPPVADVIRALDSSGASFRDISFSHASLDDVFLKLTGRTLREGAAESAWVTQAKVVA